MYSTCLHCHRSLGANDAIEHFPVGRRLAFDAEKGRLWAVCTHCARWNLSPLEERWEALEECERAFRSRPLRAQTDNVGLAKLADGTELIRIGKPLRPEFAAWRYGDVFRRRLARRIAIGGVTGGVAIAGSILSAGTPLAAAFTPLLLGPLTVAGLIALNRKRRESPLGVRVIGEHGKTLEVTRSNLNHTRIIASDDPATIRLHLRHSYGTQELSADRAIRALSTILARVNGSGALGGAVRNATDFVVDAGDPARVIARVAREAEARAGDYEERAAAVARGPHARTLTDAIDAQEELQRELKTPLYWLPPRNKGALHRLPSVYRLALEMSLHDQSEQFALEQEMTTLERDWREAEVIAAIADKLLVPLQPK